MRERNYQTCRLLLLQTSFIIWSHLSPTGEHTCFAGTATVNRSPHRHSSRHWLEAPAGSSTKKLAATSGKRHWPICWCCPVLGPGSFDVEDATTLSWSSAAVSEWGLSASLSIDTSNTYYYQVLSEINYFIIVNNINSESNSRWLKITAVVQ